MSRVTFEYVDDQGKKHKVYDIHDVPKRYVGNMLVSGSYDQPKKGRLESRTSAEAPYKVDPRLEAVIDRVSMVNVDYLIPVLLVLVWWRCKSFAVRVIVVTVACVWLFHGCYTLFERSPYSKPASKHSIEKKVTTPERHRGD